jgi:hypothetical protein
MRAEKTSRIVSIGLASVIIGAALILGVGTAAADDAPSCAFTGTASAAGSEVAGGTRVTAIIDGDRYHTHTPVGGSSYTLTIQAPEGKTYADGTPVFFEIDGYQATQTAAFQAGGSVRFDLTTAVAEAGHSAAAAARAQAYSGQAAGSSIGWGTIVGACVGVLAVTALGYYFLLLNRVFRRQARTQM